MFVVLLAVLPAGCRADSATEQAEAQKGADTDAGGLEDRQWVLDDEATGVGLDANQAVTVLFETDSFRGFNVCNSFGGEHSIEGATITITEVMSTSVGCNSQLSLDVNEVLSGTATFTVEDDRLTLTGDAGEMTLTFVELPPADDIDQAAVAGTWEVHPLDGGPPAEAAVTFTADGSYDVRVGCAEYGGRWEVDRGRIASPGAGLTNLESCYPGDSVDGPGPGADEMLVATALAGAHVRSADEGLEVLDRSGAPVAVLRPAGGG